MDKQGWQGGRNHPINPVYQKLKNLFTQHSSNTVVVGVVNYRQPFRLFDGSKNRIVGEICFWKYTKIHVHLNFIYVGGQITILMLLNSNIVSDFEIPSYYFKGNRKRENNYCKHKKF